MALALFEEDDSLDKSNGGISNKKVTVKDETASKPDSIEVFCKCGTTMELTRPRQCVISIGLQCNNKKCAKLIDADIDEWIYHCKQSSNGRDHLGPYLYCLKCAQLKYEKIRKEIHVTYLREGWMRKRPTNQLLGGKQFKRRYFKLGMDWKLWYYVSTDSVYNKDMIDLNYMTSIKKKHQYGIEIYESKGRNHWLFLTESEVDRNEWYDIMLLAYQSQQKSTGNEQTTTVSTVSKEESSKVNKVVMSTKENKCLSIYEDDEHL